MRLEDLSQMIDQAIAGRGRLYGFDCKTAHGRAELLSQIARMIGKRTWSDAERALTLGQRALSESLKACAAQTLVYRNRRAIIGPE